MSVTASNTNLKKKIKEKHSKIKEKHSKIKATVQNNIPPTLTTDLRSEAQWDYGGEEPQWSTCEKKNYLIKARQLGNLHWLWNERGATR